MQHFFCSSQSGRGAAALTQPSLSGGIASALRLQLVSQIGNLFVDRTVEVCLGVAEMGGDFSIENPRKELDLEHSWDTTPSAVRSRLAHPF